MGLSPDGVENGFPPSKGRTRKVIAAISIGNALEWYDFTVYALFAIYIAGNFFPGGDETVELLKAFLAFGLGFLIRPLGAVFLGAYADKAGRKAALFLTIMIMATGTLIIALAPPYAVLGVGGPVLVLVGRILQGFSAGGEIGGAAAFLSEYAPVTRKGLWTSWLQASMALSNIVAALVAFVVTTVLSEQSVRDWGWRIPFFVGLLIIPVGIWLRHALDETTDFKNELKRRKDEDIKVESPLKVIFLNHFSLLFKGFSLSVLWSVSVYVLIIYTPVFVQKSFGFTGSQAFLASLIGNVFLAAGCVVAGRFSDYIGRKRVLNAAALTMFVAVIPLIMWLEAVPTLATLVVVQSLFCLMVAGFVGVAPAALSHLFPTGIRSTGVSLAYNAAITVFGGFAPAVLTWLGNSFLGHYAPGWYVIIATVIALFAIWTLPDSLED